MMSSRGVREASSSMKLTVKPWFLAYSTDSAVCFMICSFVVFNTNLRFRLLNGVDRAISRIWEFKQASMSSLVMRAEAANLACVNVSLDTRRTASLSSSEKPGKPMLMIETPSSSMYLASLTLSEYVRKTVGVFSPSINVSSQMATCLGNFDGSVFLKRL